MLFVLTFTVEFIYLVVLIVSDGGVNDIVH